MTTFSVIIPTLKRPQPLLETLTSIASCEPAPIEVIVVDGDLDSESGAEPTERRFDYPITWLRSEKSTTKQRNLGIDNAQGDVVVFLDDDVRVPANALAVLESAFRDPGVVAVTGRINEPGLKRLGAMNSKIRRLLFGGGREGTFTRFGYPRYLLDLDRQIDVEFMRGCFMATRRELAARVRFDERMGGYALAEDEDFSYRLSRLGRLVYRPDIVIEHRKLGFRSYDARAFGRLVVCNRAYFFRKNFRQTPLARAQFAGFLFLLVIHRLINREGAGALGVIEGCIDLLPRRRLRE
jgi:glycosyltransferase involved in cell wall biosynthesis